MATLNRDRKAVNPLEHARSQRVAAKRVMTYARAGVQAPIMAVGLLPEDTITNGQIMVTAQLRPLAKMVQNGLMLRVRAVCIPKTADPRYTSVDEAVRSFRTEAGAAGAVIPFIETHNWTAPSANTFYHTLGLHGVVGQPVNAAYLTGYNDWLNHQAAKVTDKISPRARMLQTLGGAFWHEFDNGTIVPEYDPALFDGIVQVAMSGGGKHSVKGFYTGNTPVAATAGTPLRDTQGNVISATAAGHTMLSTANANSAWYVNRHTAQGVVSPDLWIDLAQMGTFSLAEMGKAKTTQAFAQAVEKYKAHPDHILEALMLGLRLPEQAMRQPFVVGEAIRPFDYLERHSTTSGALDESIHKGGTSVSVPVSIPPLTLGGVVLVIADVLPERLFERSEDPYFDLTNVSQMPNPVQDALRIDPGEPVLNRDIDRMHAAPNTIFGYRPFNAGWNYDRVRLGGLMYRPDPAAILHEERYRVFSPEPVNPTFNSQWITTGGEITHAPFMDMNGPAVELTGNATFVISGLTKFGPPLRPDEGAQAIVEGL